MPSAPYHLLRLMIQMAAPKGKRRDPKLPSGWKGTQPHAKLLQGMAALDTQIQREQGGMQIYRLLWKILLDNPHCRVVEVEVEDIVLGKWRNQWESIRWHWLDLLSIWRRNYMLLTQSCKNLSRQIGSWSNFRRHHPPEWWYSSACASFSGYGYKLVTVVGKGSCGAT